jgi:hypothetical protein
MAGQRRQPGSSTPQRALIVVTRPDAGVRAAREGVASSELADLLESEGAALRPLFGGNEERIRTKTSALAAETGEDVPGLSVY